jgi:hypothetical protein
VTTSRVASWKALARGSQRSGASARRERTLAALTAHWSATDLDALRRLRSVADTFYEARSRNEVDLSGTARAAAVTEEEAAGRAAFLAALQQRDLLQGYICAAAVVGGVR